MIRLHQYIPVGSTPPEHVCANCGCRTSLHVAALRALPHGLARCASPAAPQPPLLQRIFGQDTTFDCYVADPSKVGVGNGTARILRATGATP